MQLKFIFMLGVKFKKITPRNQWVMNFDKLNRLFQTQSDLFRMLI